MSEVITVGIKTVMDISDVKANVGVLQAQFNKLKLPSGITDKFNQEINKFSSTYEKYQQKMAQGIKTKGDATQTSKYLNEIAREYDNIVKVYSKASGMDLKSMFKIDSGPLKDAAAEVERLTKQLENVDIDKTGFKNLGQQLSGVLKNSKLSGEHGLINQMLGDFDKGKVNEAKQALQEIQKEIEKRQYATTTDKNGNVIQKPGTYSEANTTAALNLVNQLLAAADQAGIKIQDIQGPLNQATRNFDNLLNKGVTSFKNIGNAAQKEKAAVHGVVEENKNLVNSMANAQQQSQMLSNRIAMYFSLYEIIRKVGDVAKRAFQTVKELDASMTQTAVVTNFSVGDMWEKLPQYTATANQLGSTIKDVYDATTLYYQQGLNTNQAMGIATETLKMARIAGIEAAEATDMMTAALRGFNMQINEVSAARINDVYSKIAAITASDTEELGSAMTRTASIANSAGMEFETTTAFLAQMIETTREAPENLGTAMKTIIARFQEMKKSPEEFIDEEGNVTSINRVDTALRSVGVSLTDAQGQFRKLDDVFLDLASRWDTLSQGQQRYVATMAAGSRQQSRFIAMMSNYERTMELVDAANNSAGASQEQFSKTLESMDTKLNKLKNAWDQFAMGLTNSTILKGAIDGFTSGITIINKFIDAIGKISPKPFENINKSLVTLVGTLGLLRVGGAAFFKHQGILGGFLNGAAGFFQGESFSKIGQDIRQGFQSQQQVATEQGSQYGNAFINGLSTKIQGLKGQMAESVSTVLTSKIQQGFAQSTPQMRGTLFKVFSSSLKQSNISGAATLPLSQLWNEQVDKLQAGAISWREACDVMNKAGQEAGFTMNETALKAELLTNKVTTAGTQVSAFGSVLAHIPGLEGFGMVLMQIGGLLTTFGETLSVAAGAAKAAAAASLADSAAKGTEAAATISAAIAQGHFIVATKAAGAALKAFWVSLGPIGWAITAIIALAGAVKLLDLAIETDSEKLDSLQDRASAASDRFSEMKQATTELTDSLDKLAEYDTAFESLVSGTAEFNQQLLESNELITELIKKYPSLEQNGYITTDTNGRMNISQAGREAILEEQQQRQAKTQAIDIFANADYKRQQAVVSEEYKKAERLEQQLWDTVGDSADFNKRRELVLKEMAARREKSTADIIAKADAASAVARKQAVTSLISSQKDLIDKDSVAEVMATNYDQLIESIEADTSGEKRAKAYAEANGLEYIKGNKFRNAAGEEVEVEKDIWNDETTNKRIKANNQMIDSAGQVDQALMHLNSAAQEVFSGLDSNSLITDILSNNVNTNRDDLAKLLDSGELSKLVSQMSETDIEALKAAGIEDAQAFIEERAKAIQEVQAQQDVDLAARMARATNVDVDWFSDIRSGGLVNDLKKQLDSLTQAERSFATTTSQSLEDAFDVNVADDFIKTYTQGSKEVRKEYSTIFKDVDWTSSISALGAMQSALESNVDEVKEFGQSMKESVAGSHLLNDALQEMSVAEDFTKAMDNLDNFVEESGRLSAVGIQKMAEESSTLARMLDTGAISAGGLAAAINATSIDGTIAITDLSDSVLELLQYFGQLDDAIASAHDYIENFNPGIDTGESKDFITGNIEKIKEFANEGEWGNEQFANYIQSVIGTKHWQEALEDAGGNTRKAYDKIKGYINGFSKGYDQMWMNLTNKTDVAGKNITSKVDKNLRDITMTYDKNGKLQLDLAGHSIEDFNRFLQQAEGVTKEQADLMIEDWKNYSPNFVHDWETNKFQTALKDTNYAQEHTIRNADGSLSLAITQSEIDTLVAATNKSAEEIAKEISKAAGIEFKSNEKGAYGFKNKDREGNLREDYDKMAREYNRYVGLGGEQKLSFINQKQFTAEGGGYDIQKIIQGYIQKGFTEAQAQNMTFEQMQRHTDKEYKYNGETIDPKAFDSFTSMAEQFAEIDQNIQWEAIGEAIAKGIIEGVNNNTSESEDSAPDVKTSSEEAEQAAAKQKVLDEVRIQNLEKDISSYQKQIEEKEAQLKEAKEQVAQAKEDAKKAKTDRDKAEQKVVEAEQKVTKIQQEMADLKVLLKTTQDELGKYKKTGSQKGTSKNEETPAEQATETDLTVNYKANTEELDKAQEKLDKAEDKEVTLTVHAKGADELASATRSINGLQAAAKKGKKITSNVTINSKKGSTEGITDIKTAAKEAKAVISVTASTTSAETKVNQLVHNINNKNATINISPNFGPSADWEKAVKVKVKVRKGGKIDDSTGGSVHVAGSKGRISKFAQGGSTLTAFVPEGTDTVPAMLTPGEFVHRRKAVNYFGIDFMENINRLNLKGALNSLNNHQLTLGSMAKGSRSHGTIGPNDRGGLTLTGEKGYEVAWIPSENRSMILGANGPEMVDLPSDAVIWNHQESQNIIKKKDIPGGTAAIGAGSMVSEREVKKNKTKDSGGSGSSKSSGNSSRSGSNSTKTKKLIAQWMKWSEKVGKITNWWENISRKVEGVQRKVDKNQKEFGKIITQIGATFGTITKETSNYVESLNTSIKVNTEIQQRYQKRLQNFDTAGAKKGAITKYNTKADRVSKLQAAIDAAGKGNKVTYVNSKGKTVTTSVKAAKKSLKAQKAAAAKQKKITTKPGGVQTVSWDETAVVTTKQKGKKAKRKKQKVKRNAAVDFSKIVSFDEATGTYVADEDVINRLAGGNKKKAQAIKKQANEYIDTVTQRRNAAQDKIDAANEALQQLSKDLYDNFIGWKNELTKIYVLTKQIATLEAQNSKIKGSTSLIEAQLNSGLKKTTEDLMKTSTQLFNASIKTNVDAIEKGRDLIAQSQEEVNRLLNRNSNTVQKEIDEITNINNLANNVLTTRATAEEKAKKANEAAEHINTYKENLQTYKKQKADLEKALKKAGSSKERKEIKAQIKAVNEKIKTTNTKIATSTKTIENNTSAQADYINALNQAEAAGMATDNESLTTLVMATNGAITALKDEKAALDLAGKYIKFAYNSDGTIALDFDSDLLEADKEAFLRGENNGINSATYEKIKEIYDSLDEANSNLISEYENQTTRLTDLYNELISLREEYIGIAEELLSAQEEASRAEVDKLSKLNDSLTNHLKDLLDEVKRRLEQRRQAEDNAKTENDIIKKQQRLATLRADTSGGNASEIKQLEQEIAEAQQNYGRTLEDQTLQRLEEQADEAAKQRDHMIELLEAQLEISTNSQSNLALVEEYLSNPMAYINEIRTLWEQSVDYENLLSASKEQKEGEWENLLLVLGTYSEKSGYLTSEINNLEPQVVELQSVITNFANQLLSLKEAWSSVSNNIPEEINLSTDEVGVTPDEVPITPTTVTVDTSIIGTQQEQWPTSINANTNSDKGSLQQQIKDTEALLEQQKANYDKNIAKRKNYKKGTEKWQLYQDRAISWKNKYRETEKKLTDLKKQLSQYASGGLATSTGPAWLDGTRAKPEAVLNATDTKNFIALKDILSDVMGHIDNTNSTTYGDSTWEININVDHLNNDYDVDKVAKRVEKIITDNASYRNVTMVRKFR